MKDYNQLDLTRQISVLQCHLLFILISLNKDELPYNSQELHILHEFMVEHLKYLNKLKEAEDLGHV